VGDTIIMYRFYMHINKYKVIESFFVPVRTEKKSR